MGLLRRTRVLLFSLGHFNGLTQCPTFFQVLVELLGNKETAKEWLKVKHEHIAANEEIIKHFYRYESFIFPIHLRIDNLHSPGT